MGGSPHRLKIELDLKSLFGLHAPCAQVYSLDESETLQPPPPPRRLGSYTRAMLVSQDRRLLFVTPCTMWTSLVVWVKKYNDDLCYRLQYDSPLFRGSTQVSGLISRELQAWGDYFVPPHCTVYKTSEMSGLYIVWGAHVNWEPDARSIKVFFFHTT